MYLIIAAIVNIKQRFIKICQTHNIVCLQAYLTDFHSTLLPAIPINSSIVSSSARAVVFIPQSARSSAISALLFPSSAESGFTSCFLLCEKAARIIGLDYCGVDVLLGGVPAICEVNSNAMFAAMERTTGVNVARLYAEHIVDCVKHGR